MKRTDHQMAFDILAHGWTIANHEGLRRRVDGCTILVGYLASGDPRRSVLRQMEEALEVFNLRLTEMH